jgi:hypothetical protein
MLYISILVLTVISFIVGYIDVVEMDIIFEYKQLNNPYFNIGICFNTFPTKEHCFVEQELKIGLYLFSIIFIFYKEIDV